jgi:putative heme iron utilization protein
MTIVPLTKEDSESIVTHMNDDHSETVANYVRYFGGVKDVISAELKDITNHELYIDTVAHALSCRLAIQLVRPVKNALDAREVLVEMARQAREGLRSDS